MPNRRRPKASVQFSVGSTVTSISPRAPNAINFGTFWRRETSVRSPVSAARGATLMPELAKAERMGKIVQCGGVGR